MASLLISYDTRKASARNSLSKVILPASLVAQHGIPQGHTWWVETRNCRFSLRAKLCVVQSSFEQERKSDVEQVIWHLDPVISDRVTWPGTVLCGKSDVTDLLSCFLDTIPVGISLLSIPEDLDRKIERRRLGVSETVWQYQHAAQVLCRLFKETKDDTPPISPPLLFEQAWHYIRAYFARAELVGLPGFDAYEVAAAVLAGYTGMPEEMGKVAQHFVDTTTDQEIVYFQEIDEEHISYLEKQWDRDVHLCDNLETLERTKRHQQILQALARHIRASGFCPTHNRHIDLRVKRKDDEVFFEIKTTNPDDLLQQVRCAVGQLLEYRFRYSRQNGGKPVRLVAVIEENGSSAQYEFVRLFLANVGIVLVLWKPALSEFDGLAGLI